MIIITDNFVRDQHYWVFDRDGEPTRRDGEGWALSGGIHIVEMEIMSNDTMKFVRAKRSFN